jgi:catalase
MIMKTLCTAILGDALIGGILSSSAALAQRDTAPKAASPAGLVDALNGVFGKQIHGRAIHAKGVVLEGTFTPSAAVTEGIASADPMIDARNAAYCVSYGVSYGRRHASP